MDRQAFVSVVSAVTDPDTDQAAPIRMGPTMWTSFNTALGASRDFGGVDADDPATTVEMDQTIHQRALPALGSSF